MALTFNGSTSKLAWSGRLFNAFPFAVFFWAKPTSAATSQMAFGAGDASGPDEFACYFNGSTSGKVRVYTKTAGSADDTESTTAISTSWQPVMCMWTNSTSDAIYYAAGAVVNGSISPASTSGLTDFVIGNWAESSALPFAGDLAEFACWQGTIPDQTDFNSLAAGAHPESIKSGSLVDSWSLLTQASTQVGTVSRTLTATSTTQAGVHPITRGVGGPLFRSSPSGNLSGLGSSGPFFQNPLQRVADVWKRRRGIFVPINYFNREALA